jgi:hypothetical protein
VTRFFDPSVNFGLQFDAEQVTAFAEPIAAPAEMAPPAVAVDPATTVVSLDAFRRK